MAVTAEPDAARADQTPSPYAIGPVQRVPSRRRIGWGAAFLALGALAVVVCGLLVAPQPPAHTADPIAAQPPETTQSTPPAADRDRAGSDLVTRDEQGHLQWPRPRIAAQQDERETMVRKQIASSDLFRDAVRNERVLAAMRAVPRHEFVPPERQRMAHADTPLPIGYGQTISQPYIVALMSELLAVKEGDRVLEIGTGSGYQAAVLTELTPYVYTIEIVEPLARRARETFERLGYKTIQCRQADGYDGWPEAGPFDGIIVTCAAGHVPPPLWEQLKPGGRMVIPLGGSFETQRLLVLTKQPDGSRRSRNVLPVAFVPMTGKAAKP